MKHPEKTLLAGVSFMCALLLGRMWSTQSLTYVFLAWNIFLAAIPLVISARLKPGEKLTSGNILQLSAWLLFFPNAPYVLTDLFHFQPRQSVPQWFDLILLCTAAWNGLWMGMISLLRVERFLEGCLPPRTVFVCIAAASLLCGYGIYIGRFMRFNSWDVFTAPHTLLESLAAHFVHPFYHAEVWAFTVLFAIMFRSFYGTLKTLRPAALC